MKTILLSLASLLVLQISFGQILCSNDTIIPFNNLPGPLAEHRAIVYNSEIYVFGGHNGTEGVKTVYKYSSTSSNWITLDSLPTARYEMGVAELNGTVYCFGGSSSINEAYNISTNSWQTKASMPVSMIGCQAVTLNNKVYIIGASYGLTQNYFYEYNPATDTYTSLSLPTQQRNHPRLIAYNNKIYMLGGYYWDGSSNPDHWSNNLDVYDPISNAWTPLSNIPLSAARLGITILDNILHVFGGEISFTAVSNSHLAYNFLTDTWVALSNLPFSLAALEACTINDTVYLTGGVSVDGSGQLDFPDSCNKYYCGENPCPGYLITGKVTYDNISTTPMSCAQVFLKTTTGTIVDSTLTDDSGNYQFCGLVNGTYKVTAKTNKAWGGVNSTDALLATRHFVGIITLTGMKKTAGDVNNTTFINSTDALLIAKRYTGQIPSFAIQDWLFEDKTVTVSGSSVDSVVIKAICAGDVNGSYNPPGCGFQNCGDTLTDERDGQKYPTVLIGTQCWMKKNLNIGYAITGTQDMSDNNIIEKYCYDNDMNKCAVYGGLYQWDEMMQYSTTPGAMGICPTGWHVPSNMDWCTLTTYLDTSSLCENYSGLVSNFAGGKMKEPGLIHWASPNIGGINTSGFTGLGGGSRDENANFWGFNNLGIFWASSELSTMDGYYWNLDTGYSWIARNFYPKSCGLSIRCVKD